MRLTRILLPLGLLVFIGALAYLLTVQQTLRRRQAVEVRQPANVLSLSDTVIRRHEGEALRWIVWAEEARFYENRQETRMRGVRFEIYPREDAEGPREPVQGTSARARLAGAEDTLVLEEDVHIEQGTRTELRAERVVYHHDAERLLVPEEVWLRQEATRYRGRNLRYDIAAGRLRLDEPTVVQ